MVLAVTPPIAPMLARLAREVPEGDFVYEPKWDGFRCLAFVDTGGEVDLRSRNQRPLARYFPEIVEALRAVGRPAGGARRRARRGRADRPRLRGPARAHAPVRLARRAPSPRDPRLARRVRPPRGRG